MGGELLGRGLRAQVCALKLRRLARGRYELTLEPLNQPGEKLPHGEVTTRYARNGYARASPFSGLQWESPLWCC